MHRSVHKSLGVPTVHVSMKKMNILRKLCGRLMSKRTNHIATHIYVWVVFFIARKSTKGEGIDEECV